MSIARFEDLDVWQRAHEAVLDVYDLTKRFPREELFGLSLQMRKAAVSVPANIAEGFARMSPRDKARIYNIGQGSTDEMKYYTILTPALKYAVDTTALYQKYEDVSRMLRRLVHSTLRL